MALVLRMAATTLLLTCRQEIFVECNQMELFDVPAYSKKRSKNIELVENNKMRINSSLLITELKDFVATGLSYKAKPGQTDDLVMSCLLMTRIMKVLADFDPKIFEKWTDRTSEWTAPMPIFANLYG